MAIDDLVTKGVRTPAVRIMTLIFGPEMVTLEWISPTHKVVNYIRRCDITAIVVHRLLSSAHRQHNKANLAYSIMPAIVHTRKT